jgi:hypothetical protein
MAIPTPTRLYRFAGNLYEHFGGPSFEGLGGSIGGLTRYEFSENLGLAVTGLPVSTYTLAFRFQYAPQLPLGGFWYYRILHWYNVSAAQGDLFLTNNGDGTNNGCLEMAASVIDAISASVFVPATNALVVITRNGATKAVVVYANGAQVLAFTDTLDEFVFSDGQALLFRETVDPVTGPIPPNFSLDYVAVWASVLAGADVAALNPATLYGEPAPRPVTDIVERSKIALVAVLSANADIQAIMQRSQDNVTAWGEDLGNVVPILAYQITIATPGGGAIGDTREAVVVFTAIAPMESDANALIDVVEHIAWAPKLAALGLDGYMRNPVRRSFPHEGDEDDYRVDLEYTLTVTR